MVVRSVADCERCSMPMNLMMPKRNRIVCYASALLLVSGLFSLQRTRSIEPVIASAENVTSIPVARPTSNRTSNLQGRDETLVSTRSQVVATSSEQSSGSIVRFELARSCHWTAANSKQWSLQLKICRSSDASDSAFSESCKERARGLDEKIAQADKEMALCSPVPAEIEENYYRSTVEAAKAGYPDAQLCYLDSDFYLNRPFSQEDVRYYHSVDADYVNAAIDRGDWRIVALMARKYRDPAHHSTMRYELTGGSPYTIYQMNKLLSLGAEGDYKRVVETEANDQAAELTPQQIDEANTWVATVYERHFASSPRLTNPPVPCEQGK